jgi:putative hydrolase of the HAD superfamily
VTILSIYFVEQTWGWEKRPPDYFGKIVERLNVNPERVTMVGDSFERDVQQALKVGIKAVWFNPNNVGAASEVLTINKLNMLT